MWQSYHDFLLSPLFIKPRTFINPFMTIVHVKEQAFQAEDVSPSPAPTDPPDSNRIFQEPHTLDLKLNTERLPTATEQQLLSWRVRN